MCQLVANNSNRTGFHLCVSYCRYVRSCASAGARWGRRKSLMHFLLTITCYTQQNHREIVKGQSFLCVERIRVSKRKKQYALKYIYIYYTNSQLFMFALPHLCCACFFLFLQGLLLPISEKITSHPHSQASSTDAKQLCSAFRTSMCQEVHVLFIAGPL